MSKKLPPEKQALRRAVEIVGGLKALADILGYRDRRSVWPWLNIDRVLPAEYCPLIERATKGEVRCEDLRPDVAWDVLRDQCDGDCVEAATHGA